MDNPLLDKFDKDLDGMTISVADNFQPLEDKISGKKTEQVLALETAAELLLPAIKKEVKSLAHSHLEEAYRAGLADGAEPKKICITCLEKTGEIVPSHSDQSNLERLIEKCGDKLMSIHRTVPPKNMGDYWCAEAYFEMEKDEETPLSGRIGLGSTPTEAVENLIKALNL